MLITLSASDGNSASVTDNPDVNEASGTKPISNRGGWSRLLQSHVLDSRTNSLNLVRLVLAVLVILSHSFTLGGFGEEPKLGNSNLGRWAVACFFCLSGFLIMGSRRRYRVGEFLMHRLARIYPGYLVCTIVTIVVFAPVAYLVQNGTLSGYLTVGQPTPLTHLWANLFLRIGAYEVSGTPAGVPYPQVWNGSLWSLYYEFLCYLILAALGLFGLFRRSPWAVGACFAVSVILQMNHATIQSYVTQIDFPLVIELVPYFLGGALFYMIQTRVPLSLIGFVVAVATTIGLVSYAPDWGPQLAAPVILYILLWVGNVLPSPAAIRRQDISYGVYIYAFPVQQMLAIAGFQRFGVVAYIILSILGTVPLAILSWFAIERPVLNRVKKVREVPRPVVPALIP